MNKATDWYQTSLLSIEVVEVRIRLGVIPERDHAQALVELVEPTTGRLIAQWSRAHIGLDGWQELLKEAVQKAQDQLGAAIEPF